MIWSWGTFFTWVDILLAVGTFSWEDDWLGDTVSESLSLWEVWAMFESIWIDVGGSNWDVSWDDVLWPWSSNLTEGIWPWGTGLSWIDIWDAISTLSWPCDWNGGTVSKSLSLRSIWAMFKTSWVGWTSNVSWGNILWPWGVNLRKGPCWVAVETFFWIWDS